MPSWSEILAELQQTQSQIGQPPFDVVRRKYLALLNRNTKRNVILYATSWTQPRPIDPTFTSITDEDVQGFMEVVKGLKGDKLDLILHSPGGSGDAGAAIVSYLRSKFKDIRVIVPQAAMSAACMISCAGNTIVMGKHSSLGPIDPQMILKTQLGVRYVPAQAILDQFELAKTECQDPKKLGSWAPILVQYGPALLIESQNALKSSESIVSNWLEAYMFAHLGTRKAKNLAKKTAKQLANHQYFKSHSYHINREEARSFGLIIEDLEKKQKFQDLVLSVFHSTTHTFDGTPAVKIIENHKGRAFIKAVRMVPPPAQSPSQPPQRPASPNP